MFDRHFGRVMFEMVAKFLGVICVDWRIRLLNATSDKARNIVRVTVGSAEAGCKKAFVGSPKTVGVEGDLV
jgi:hypothetical protein